MARRLDALRDLPPRGLERLSNALRLLRRRHPYPHPVLPSGTPRPLAFAQLYPHTGLRNYYTPARRRRTERPALWNRRARYLYVVDSEDAFLRFDPEMNTLTPIGTLSCPTTSSPFSMAVDRDATAWVLYQDGRIYRVSTTDVSGTATSFTPSQAGFEVFGMGFVADAPGSTEETLFVAGGSLFDVTTGTASLGRIDSSLTLTRVGGLPGWPELTGTGVAELRGFFPDTSPPSVRQIDQSSGATRRTFPMSELGSGSGLGDRAWAFAFWGARF